MIYSYVGVQLESKQEQHMPESTPYTKALADIKTKLKENLDLSTKTLIENAGLPVSDEDDLTWDITRIRKSLFQ